MATDGDFGAGIGKPDIYGGLKIESAEVMALVSAEMGIQMILEKLLDVWRTTKRRGIWIRVDREHSSILPMALQLGFDIHHAHKEYIQLNIWLPKEEPNKLPHYGCTYVGVGGIVIDKNNRILVLKERYSMQRQYTWKVPTGLVERGEDLVTAAIREVQEETGVLSKFVSILGLRHILSAPSFFGSPDLFFFVLLEPLSDKIEIDPGEVEECEWQDLATYGVADTTNPTMKHAVACVQRYLAGAAVGLCRKEIALWGASSHTTSILYFPDEPRKE